MIVSEDLHSVLRHTTRSVLTNLILTGSLEIEKECACFSSKKPHLYMKRQCQQTSLCETTE